MKKIFIILLSFFFSNTLFLHSQTINDANLLYNSQKYSEALSIYATLLKSKKKDIALNFGVGKTLFALEKYEESIDYLKVAAEKNFENSTKLLALANFYTYRFAEAADYFEKNISDDTENFYNRAKIGTKMLQKIENVSFIDSIILDKNDLLKHYPQNSDIGFIFSDTTENICGALFGFLSGRKDRKIFALNVDNQTDLYQSNYFLSGWSEPIKLSETLNTNFCENYPFVLSDGVTLYFASQGHDNLGGYDIFVSRANASGEFLAPQNVGMPFNSTANDYLMVIDEQKNIGYFATDRDLPEDKVAVYQFIFNEQKNILREKNEDILREKARKISISPAPSPIGKEEFAPLGGVREGVTSVEMTSEFYFILTDTIVYKHFNDFKNEEALQMFYQLKDLEKNLFLLKSYLNNYRELYINADAKNKNILTEKILEYEKKLQGIESQINTLTKEVRKIETVPKN